MIFNESPPGSVGAEPVRLLALGSTGMRFAKTLAAGATGPLVNLLPDHPQWLEPEDLTEAVLSFDFEGIALLFIVIGVDATDFEVGLAVMLAWFAWQAGVATIGIFVRRPAEHLQLVIAGRKWPWQPAILLSFLVDLVDGRIEDLSDDSVHDLNAVRWFYGTLRALAREGILILEPAWDLHDITEVLDLPGARLALLTRTVEVGETALTAVKEALVDFEARGIELELAGGVLVIVWQGPPHRLTVRQVSAMSRMVRDALGAGGQHLVLIARDSAAPQQRDGMGACATLVVSRRSQHGAVEVWP